MSVPHQTIHIHAEAPPKPALGAPCNGCGVCCLAEPCPVGMLVSRKRSGACVALVWRDASGTEPARYQCGLMLQAAGQGSEGAARGLPWWRRVWLAWVRRLIASGSGCDASLELVLGETPSAVPQAGAKRVTSGTK